MPYRVVSAVPPGAQALIEALKAAGCVFRVSQEQPDGMTPVFVAEKRRFLRAALPPGAVVRGERVDFPEEWVVFFFDSDHAGPPAP